MAIASVFNSSGGAGIPSLKMMDLSSQIDNSNQLFVIEPYQRGTLIVYFNGIAQRLGYEITQNSSSTFSTSFIPRTDSILFVFFQPI